MADDWRQHVIDNMLPKMEATEPAAGFTPAPMVMVPAPTPFSTGPQLQPQFDPLEILPPAAADRLRALRQRATDAHLLVPPFEQIREASMLRVEAENAVRRLVDHPHQHGAGLSDSDRRVQVARQHLDKMAADFRRKQELQTDRTAQWHAASGALANVETWLKSGRPTGVQLLEWEGEPPKLLKGEAVLDGIERLRRRVRELRADQHRIASAPYPSSYAKQRMRAQIEALAMQGAPSVSRLVELDGPVDFQTQRLRSEAFGAEKPVLVFAEVPDIAVVAWLHKDALIAALDREIATEADDKAALSHEARQKAEAEVMGDLLAVERDESALVFKAWADSLPCEHRSDCSPLALLGLRLVTAPRADPPPTSPEHGYNIVGGARR